MKLITTFVLREGYSKAFWGFRDYSHGYEFNQSRIDWLYSNEAEQYTRNFKADICENIIETMLSNEQLTQYVRIVYYEFLLNQKLRYNEVRKDFFGFQRLQYIYCLVLVF